ncbi:MAG: hypothetical protein P8N94_03110 [Gammaproteobacteria bacterium]|nr:hypothetical protein [Gammaproteobacteria bacterium]MDG2336965.1 hypothetical protein [Gammaproteobacteria bacterium]
MNIVDTIQFEALAFVPATQLGRVALGLTIDRINTLIFTEIDTLILKSRPNAFVAVVLANLNDFETGANTSRVIMSKRSSIVIRSTGTQLSEAYSIAPTVNMEKQTRRQNIRLGYFGVWHATL